VSVRANTADPTSENAKLKPQVPSFRKFFADVADGGASQVMAASGSDAATVARAARWGR
jgi:hypothetical protein